MTVAETEDGLLNEPESLYPEVYGIIGQKTVTEAIELQFHIPIPSGAAVTDMIIFPEAEVSSAHQPCVVLGISAAGCNDVGETEPAVSLVFLGDKEEAGAHRPVAYSRLGDGRDEGQETMQVVQVITDVKGVVEGVLERFEGLFCLLCRRSPSGVSQEDKKKKQRRKYFFSDNGHVIVILPYTLCLRCMPRKLS